MIYPILLVIHNALRWLVLTGILAVLVTSYEGWFRQRAYRPIDQMLRVVATSIAHTQLLVGFYLYAKSPVVRYYWTFSPNTDEAPEFRFFSLVHIGLMFTAVVLVTIGSSKAKRLKTPEEKFKTTAIYFTIGLLLILIAVPWPFSPLATRPWTRSF